MKVFFSYIDTKHGDEREKNVIKMQSLLKGNKSNDVFVYRAKGESSKAIDSFELFQTLRSADVFIGEMSRPSQSLGFLLANAINLGKPSIYLYLENTAGKPADPIYKNPSRLLTVKSYNEESIGVVIKDFLRKAQNQLLSDRITFVCSQSIRKYIDELSQKRGVAKGELIRSIIEDKMKTDNYK